MLLLKNTISCLLCCNFHLRTFFAAFVKKFGSIWNKTFFVRCGTFYKLDFTIFESCSRSRISSLLALLSLLVWLAFSALQVFVGLTIARSLEIHSVIALLWHKSKENHIRMINESSTCLSSEWSMTKMYKRGGMMKVRHVIVLPPTKSRMLPKLGTDWPMKSSTAIEAVRNAHLFQLNSADKNRGRA